MSKILNFLYTNHEKLPYILLIIVILAIVLMIFLIMGAENASKLDAKTKKKEPKKKKEKIYGLPPWGGKISEYLVLNGWVTVNPLSLNFLKGLEFLEQTLNSVHYKYRLPWFLVMGAKESGKTSLLKSSGIYLPVGSPEFTFQNTNQFSWWFFDKGIVLDVDGTLVIDKNGAVARDHDWRQLISLLGRYRTSRPLDGIVLTIPADEIYGSHALSQSELIDRSKFISKKILDAQEKLGIVLPVYIVITKSDLIPGFREFIDSIPVANSHNMLGWSNDKIDAPYNFDLLSEAFAQIEHRLSQLRLEILTLQSSTNNENLFLLPKIIAELQKNVHLYCEELFRSHVYKHHPLLRGIYFTAQHNDLDSLIQIESENQTVPNPHVDGQPTPIEVPDLEPGRPTLKVVDNTDAQTLNALDKIGEISGLQLAAKGKIYFAHDLFERKVFLETGIAKAIPNRVRSASYVINTAKVGTVALSVAGTFGLAHSYKTIQSHSNHIIRILQEAQALLKHSLYPVTSTQQRLITFNSQVINFDNLMNELQSRPFFSIFLPSSWSSDISEKLYNALKISHDHLIVRTIYNDLLNKTQEIFSLQPTIKDQSKSIAQVLNPITSPEFLLLKQFVEKTLELLKAFENFNQIRETASVKPFKELVEYCLGQVLSPAFYENYYRFRDNLSFLPYAQIDPKIYENVAQVRLEALYDYFLRAILSPQYLSSIPGRLNVLFESIRAERVTEKQEIDTLRAFQNELSIGTKRLGEPGKNWIDLSYFNPGQEFLDLIDLIENHPLFGKFVVDHFAKKTAFYFNDFIKTLESYVPQVVPTILLTKRKKPLLSEMFFDLGRFLDKLFQNNFMQEPRYLTFSPKVPQGKVVYWDPATIKAAEAMVSEFETYEKNEFQLVPPVGRQGFLSLIKSNLESNLIDSIVKAQTFVDAPAGQSEADVAEEILQGKLENTRAISKEFNKLLGILKTGNLSRTFIELRNLIAELAQYYLRLALAGVEAGGYYQVKENNFSWWDGEEKPAYAGFSVKDYNDLKTYLEFEKTRLKHWAIDYAEILVTGLTGDAFKDAPLDFNLIRKWKLIVEQLKASLVKKPNSTVTTLENYIVHEMNKVNLKNCFEKIPLDEAQLESADFFLNAFYTLKRQMRSQCELLIRKRSLENYQKMVDFFDDNLKGKFPFIDKKLRNYDDEADPDDIKKFFELYIEAGGTPKKILDQVHQLGSVSKQQLAFLDELDKVKDFFADFIKQKDADNAVPYWDFVVGFKTNTEDELSAQGIVDYYLSPDEDTTIDSYDKKLSGRWTYGSPFEFGFKFSDAAIYQPVPDPNQPYNEVKKRTALFKFTNQWSMFAAIRNLQVDNSQLKNSRTVNHTLRFSISRSDKTKSVVFNQITISAPSALGKKRIDIDLPTFPVKAPQFSDRINDFTNEPVLTLGKVGVQDETLEKASQEESEDQEETEEGNNAESEQPQENSAPDQKKKASPPAKKKTSG